MTPHLVSRSTDRILATWLASGLRQLEEALKGGRPSSIAAAYAAMEELKVAVRMVRTTDRMSA